MLEPDGSPLFPCIPLAACRRYEPRKHPRTLAITHPQILPSPLGDKIGCFHHDRFRGYVSVHCCSGLLPPCLRFVMLVTDHHARLGTRLLAKLYRGRHLRRLDSMSFQGATPADPDMQVSRIRLFGSRLCYVRGERMCGSGTDNAAATDSSSPTSCGPVASGDLTTYATCRRPDGESRGALSGCR